MAQTRKMESSNGFLLMFGGVLAVFLNWMFTDVQWVLGGFWKAVMSLVYGGVGAYGAYFTRKYIIANVEKHKGFWKWMKFLFRFIRVVWKRWRGRGDGDTPKQ